MGRRLGRGALAGLLVAAVVVLPRPGAPDAATPQRAAEERPARRGPHVLAISVDGLNVDAIRRLGPRRAPAFHRMLTRGAGTLNARTEREMTVTLPNHTSMVTGRRIAAGRRGHGVTWNDERTRRTVQQAAGHPVASVFSVVDAARGSTALWAMKPKFLLFDRSWPHGVDRVTVRSSQRRLVALARADLRRPPRFTFLHLALPDLVGHRRGGMSPAYLRAVRRTDTHLGRILRTVAGSRVTVILTADHGFAPGRTSHADPGLRANYTVPFLVWGAGVDRGGLYRLNPGYRDPGARRTRYAGRPPIRNGDVADLATSLLGLRPVPGSRIGVRPPLVVQR